MKRYGLAVLVLVMTLGLPAKASAGWFIGLGFGTSTGGSVVEGKRTFTGQLGTVDPDKWVGFEFDYATYNRTPDLDVRTFTAGILVGRKVFREFRAYGSVGGGIIGPVHAFLDIFKAWGSRPNDPIVTFGGGVMGDVFGRLGVRFDVRQIMDLKKPAAPDSRFGFTRVTVNAYVRF